MANHSIKQFDIFKVRMSPYADESKKERPGSIPSSQDRIIKFRKDKYGSFYINYNDTYSKVEGINTLKGYIGDHIVLMDPYNKDIKRFYKVLVYRRAIVCDNQIPVIPLVTYVKGEDIWNADKVEKVYMLPQVLQEIHRQEMMFHEWNAEFKAILNEAREKQGDGFKGFTDQLINVARDIINERHTSKSNATLWKIYGEGYISNTNHEKKGRDAALKYQMK